MRVDQFLSVHLAQQVEQAVEPRRAQVRFL